MPTPALATLALVLSRFSLCFGAPSFVHHLVLVTGWLLTEGSPHAVTEALVSAGVSATLDWWPFHRFFSRARWSVDRLGLTVAELLRELGVSWSVVIDDTLCRHKGAHVFGATMHVDPVTSTASHKNFARGHCWVILSVVFSVPWSPHPWSVPLLFRLYRGKDKGPKKTELARELLALFVAWQGKATRLRVLLDSGYMARELVAGWPTHLVFLGALRTNAALYAPLPKGKAKGRRRRGDRRPTPAEMAATKRGWHDVDLTLYGREVTKAVHTERAQWWRVFGDQVGRLVVVREDSTKVRVFFSTDPSLSATEVLVGYSFRWPQEVWHRGGKSWLGFDESSARSELAVLRTAPWVGLLTGVLVVWFWAVWRSEPMGLPVRPWYPHKEGLSLQNVVRLARRTLGGVGDVEAWARAIAGREAWVTQGARSWRQPSGDKLRTEVQATPMAA